ncbi:hypothetical protein JTB14_015420 [Gonioctena quinquepunctata]|nr:hypothetical protein JTB14_015420 [Gonioctena quinquepunctata]
MEEYKVKIHILAESAKKEETLPPKIDGAKITQANKEVGKLLNKRKDYPKINVDVHNRFDPIAPSDRSNPETDKEIVQDEAPFQTAGKKKNKGKNKKKTNV